MSIHPVPHFLLQTVGSSVKSLAKMKINVAPLLSTDPVIASLKAIRLVYHDLMC